MQITLTGWSEKDTCIWCEKEKECVTAEFGDSFTGDGQFCWRCFQKAVKVQGQKPKKLVRRSSTVSTRQEPPPQP